MRVDRHLSGPIRFTGIPDQASNRCSQACDSAPAVSRATRKEPNVDRKGQAGIPGIS